MKAKRILALCLFTVVFCYACQKTADYEETNTNAPEKVAFSSNENIEKNQSTESTNKQGYDFPSVYQAEIENVQFETEIVVSDAVKSNGLYQTRIELKERDYETPCDVFFGDVTIVKKNDTEAKAGEKCGRIVYCTGDDGRSLCMDRRSLSISVKGYRPLLGAISLEEDETYNANLYLTGEEFDFMSIEEAYEYVLQYMSDIGMNMKDTDTFEYNCYSLNYKTMEEVERIEKENMPIEMQNPDAEEKQWTEDDNAYLFAIHQHWQDCIVQYPIGGVFPKVSDVNASVIAIVSKDGIKRLESYELFEFEQGDEWLDLLTFEDIASHIAAKYNMILTDSTYIVKKAELYWRPIDHEDFSFEMVPVWEVTVEETSSGKSRCIYINALNGEEIG